MPTADQAVPLEDNEIHDIREVDGSGEIAGRDFSEPTEPVDIPTEPGTEPETEPAPETEAPETDAIQSLRDAASELGYDVSKFEDDASVLSHLVSQASQSQAREQQLYQYQQMMAAQPQAPTAPQPEEAPLWSPPEFNPMWLTQVERNAEGNLIPTSGGTPETVNKVLAWAQYRQEQQDKFWSNPFEYMRPMVEQVARDQTMTGLQSSHETMSAQQLVEKNADWIYDGDPTNRKFTPDGQLFFESAQKFPNASPQQQYDFAMAQVNATRANRELETLKKQQTTAETHAEKKRAAIGTKPNSSGTLQDVEQNPTLTLKERMMAAMAKHGVTANDLETSGTM